MSHIMLSEIASEVKPIYHLYIDMDGVIANFDGGFEKISGGLSSKEYASKYGKSAFWKLVASKKSAFFSDLEWMPDGKILWDFCWGLPQLHEKPTILTATGGDTRECANGKNEWIRKNIQGNPKVLFGKSSEKHVGIISPIAKKNEIFILIDDRPKNIDPWNAAGGVGLLHTDAASTISTLKEIILQ